MAPVRYSERSAAIHELGHALIACHLSIPFECVYLIPARSECGGWEGQCKLLESCSQFPEIYLDAYQIGGPLLQLAMIPESLGEHIEFFSNSLFGRCKELQGDRFEVLNDLRWASDLGHREILFAACKLTDTPPNLWKRLNIKPWLFELERYVRDFTQQQAVQEAAQELAKPLSVDKHITAEMAHAIFSRKGSTQDRSGLREYVKAATN